MRMEKVLEDPTVKSCEMCFLRNPLPWVAVSAIPLLIFAGFWGFGFLSIFLTSSALILSTVLFSSAKNKPHLQEEEEEDQILTGPCHQETSADHMEHLVSDPQPESESTTQEKESANEGNQVHDDFLIRSSESECLDHSSTSEDSEAEWIFRDNVDHSPDWSDGSISDEESLIEIALPSGHYVDHSKKLEEPKFINLAPQPIFQQHSLMELLAEINEMNEEDNLIEIDISMGSIKCSRFEIQA